MTLASLLLLILSPQGALEGPSLLSDGWSRVPVGGLERTGATANVVSVSRNRGFGEALRVIIGRSSTETNATQLTLPILGKVEAGDALMASLWVRGHRKDGKPGRIELLFEKSTSPWTKSVTAGIVAGDAWREIAVPFRAIEGYAAGEAMLSLRFAFGPQTVEVANVGLANLGKRSLESLVETAASRQAVGTVIVTLNPKATRQTMLGFGGNFCQPRYGSTVAMDAVGAYALSNLKVAHARVGLPLEKWNPEPGVFHDDAQAGASLQILRTMAKRRIPTVLSIWEGPRWMLGGSPEESGRVLDGSKYDACIDAIVRYLVLARDKYGAKVDYLSFNEPDYGVNFKFTPATMAAFIRGAGPRLRDAGLVTKFLVGDTAGGSQAVAFDEPLLSDPSIAPFLGPISFHCWDVLSASEDAYTAIASLGARFKKPVWCLEAGHDAQLWQAKDPWGSWENALRTAMAYEKTLRLAQPSVMDYWTYQDNYPLIDKNGPKPYPVFHVMRQMEDVFRPGVRVVATAVGSPDVQALGTVSAKRTAILLVNPAGGGKTVLRGLPAHREVRVITSDRKSQLRATRARTDARGSVTISLPMRSVVTVVTR